MRSVHETAALIASRLSAVEGREEIPLAIAVGRTLVKDMVAPLPLPPFTNSAVDGYALRGADLPQTAEKAFPVADRIQAGVLPERSVAPGQAVRIFTGAPMPDGADTVYMQEDVRVDDAGRVVLPPGLKRGANVRPAGEDIAAGKVVLQAGQQMRPQDVALAAALGMTHVEVLRKVRVAIFSTGDEIVAPGSVRGPAQLFDSNRFMLMAMLSRMGCDVTDLGILADDSRQIAEMLKAAASTHDLMLTSGGVSTGGFANAGPVYGIPATGGVAGNNTGGSSTGGFAGNAGMYGGAPFGGAGGAGGSGTSGAGGSSGDSSAGAGGGGAGGNGTGGFGGGVGPAYGIPPGGNAGG